MSRYETYLRKIAGEDIDISNMPVPSDRYEYYLRQIAENGTGADPEAIAEAVTDWLDEHVDPDTGYVIDNTLLVEGAAADAKKVGDELTDVKSAFNKVLDYNGINNAFDGQMYNGYWSSAGVLTAVQNDVCCAGKIACPANANVVLITKTNVTGYAIYISYFDEAGTTRLRRDVASSAKYEGVSPAGTYWFAFTYEKAGITKDNFGTAEVYINNAINALQNDIDRIDDDIDAVKAGDFDDASIGIKKTDFLAVEIGNNLHDPSTDVPEYWFTTSNGNVILQTNQYTSVYTAILVLLPDELPEYITVSANAQYAYLHSYYMIGATAVPAAALSSAQPEEYVPNGYAIAVPTGAKAVCLNMQNISNAIVMVNVGNTKMPSEPYEEKYLLKGKQIAFEGADKELLKLPASYHAVVGDAFELFYKGIANVINPDIMEFDLTATAGKAFDKKYKVTPSASGTMNVGIAMRDNSGDVVETGSVDIVTVAAPSSPQTQKNILCIGDSLTQDGVWCAELNRRLTGSGGTPAGLGLNNINFIGTCANGDTHYEGYGGWSINSYLSSMSSDANMLINGTFTKTEADQHSIYKDSNNKQWKLETIGASQMKIIRVSDSGTLPSSGTLTWVSGGMDTADITYTSSEQASGNPFWNSETGKNDWSAYATEMGVTSIDYAIILLGWNSQGATETDYKEKVTQFVTELQETFESCKVILLGLQIPSRNGLANNYGTGWKYYNAMQFVWKMNKWYSELAGTLSNTTYVDLSGQFDSEHGYPTITETVNTRSATTETIQSNGVHPNTSGKYQIADAVYRELCALL